MMSVSLAGGELVDGQCDSVCLIATARGLDVQDTVGYHVAVDGCNRMQDE